MQYLGYRATPIHPLLQRAGNLLRALNTSPGTIADDIGCLAAMAALAMAAYVLLGLT